MGKLVEMRRLRGLSQQKLAQRANLNVRVLQAYEQGARDFDHARMETLLRVCIALNCRLEDIIEDRRYIELIHEYGKL